MPRVKSDVEKASYSFNFSKSLREEAMAQTKVPAKVLTSCCGIALRTPRSAPNASSGRWSKALSTRPVVTGRCR